jgi:hypothetical protein
VTAAEEISIPDSEPESVSHESLIDNESAIPTLADEAIRQDEAEQEAKRQIEREKALDQQGAEDQNENEWTEEDGKEEADDVERDDGEELDDNDDGPDFTALRKALDTYEAKSAEYDREISNPEPPFLKVRFRHQRSKIEGLKQVVDRAFASMIASAQVIVESVDLPLLTECKCTHTLDEHEKGAKCSECSCEKHEVNREKIVAYLRRMVGYEEPLAPEAIKVNTWH